MVDLKELKMEYNYNLNRLYNGCNYVDEHPEQCDKYIDEIFKIYKKANEIIEKIMKYQEVSPDETLGGFKIN